MKREIVEVIQLVLVKSINGRVADQMVDIPVSPVMEEIMAIVQEEEKLFPQERVQQPTVEHAPVPQIQKVTSLVPWTLWFQAAFRMFFTK